MIFKNRQHAGLKLAQELADLEGTKDLLVLGLPRGGIPVAFEVAQRLHAPLDVFLSRKLGVPGQEELAFGAVAANGGRYLDEEIVASVRLEPDEIEKITHATEKTLEERARIYREGRSPLQVEGRTVVLVDDGVATGASIYAAMRALQGMKPKSLIVAVPVASRSACNRLRRHADRLVVLYAPENFYAVGQFYEDFSQVPDAEVVDLLRRADKAFAMVGVAGDCPGNQHSLQSAMGNTHHEIVIKADDVSLEGLLGLPFGATAIVLFAHGSGSSRHSARNHYVAEYLQSHGIATLLFDLLTADEERVDRISCEHRFNIDLLAERLIAVTRWIRKNPLTRSLRVAYFGASTGAAAAFVAAAALPESIAAVVSRGGRPDLAGEALDKVRAPSLLIVGSRDEQVIALNRTALDKLQCENKEIILVRGATHLFEEPGCLEQVAFAATDWLSSIFNREKKGADMNERIERRTA